jgi:glycosyltransferase involved in cell wall biosynthesis
MFKNKTNQTKLLFFGYPSNATTSYTGGHLWMKKVADHIEKNSHYSVLKIYTHYASDKLPFKIIYDIVNVIKALVGYPHVAILDAWGESNILLWILLRLLKPKTKIFTVFHHHEPRILSCKNFFDSIYNFIVEKAVVSMLKDSDIILTVSQASKLQLNNIYGIGSDKINKIKEKADEKNNKLTKNIKNKITIVGTGIDKNFCFKNKNKEKIKKDIDFLCIGRIEKFHGLEKIWIQIKEQLPNANLVVIGRITEENMGLLCKMGIDHRGFVSENEKISLYSKSKVFIFPSSMEGFGIAVAEAIYTDIPVIAWKLPVFEEFYLKDSRIKIKLIEFGDYNLFANECVKTLNEYGNTKENDEEKRAIFQFPSWQNVAKNVMTTIDSVNINLKHKDKKENF